MLVVLVVFGPIRIIRFFCISPKRVLNSATSLSFDACRSGTVIHFVGEVPSSVLFDVSGIGIIVSMVMLAELDDDDMFTSTIVESTVSSVTDVLV